MKCAICVRFVWGCPCSYLANGHNSAADLEARLVKRLAYQGEACVQPPLVDLTLRPVLPRDGYNPLYVRGGVWE